MQFWCLEGSSVTCTRDLNSPKRISKRVYKNQQTRLLEETSVQPLVNQRPTTGGAYTNLFCACFGPTNVVVVRTRGGGAL